MPTSQRPHADADDLEQLAAEFLAEQPEVVYRDNQDHLDRFSDAALADQLSRHGPGGSARSTSGAWSKRSGACAARGSASLKRWIFDLQPISHPPAPVGPAQAFADDPLEVHLARLLEHDRALGLDRLAEHEGVDAGDDGAQLGRLRKGAEYYAKPRTRFPYSLSSPLGPTYR